MRFGRPDFVANGQGARMRPQMRRAVAVALLIVATTTGINGLTQHVSESFQAMIRELPFKAATPIARDVRFTLFERIYLNEKPQQPTMVTNEPQVGKKVAMAPALIPRVG